jgi:hypothetical protein
MQGTTARQQAMHDSVQEYLSRFDEGLVGQMCPLGTSRMFIQGALGEDTLLPQSVIDRVVTTQAPTMGSRVIPSKYYHVMAAAYLTCSLVREGMPPIATRRIQQTLVRNYRMRRLCGEISQYAGFRQNIDQVNREQFLAAAQRFRSGEMDCNFKDPMEHIESLQCGLLSRFTFLDENLETPLEILGEKYDNLANWVLAAELFNNEVADPSACYEVLLTNDRIDRLERMATRTDPGTGRYGAEACRAARELMQTWHVDFVWTGEQHRLGTEFAINNCQREPNFTDQRMEHLACEQLGTAEGDTTEVVQ